MIKFIDGEYLNVDETLNKYINLVNSEVNRAISIGSKSDRDDLFQEGLIALKKAYYSYDENKKVKFITYSLTSIRNAIKNFSIEDKTIRIPKTRFYEGNREELANSSNSLDEVLDDEDHTGMDLIQDNNGSILNPEKYSDYEYIKECINNLSETEKEIIKLRFGFTPYGTLSYREISNLLYINIKEVNRLYLNALTTLKSQFSL